MALLKKKITIFSIIVLLFLIFPSFFLGIFFRDIPPVNDRDLTFEKIAVPDGQNAYYDFISLEKGNEVEYPENYADINTCLADEKCLEEAGAANEKNFPIVDQILSKPYFLNPNYAEPSSVSLFNGIEYNNGAIFYIASLQPYYFLQKGEDEKAIEAALNMFELAQKIKSGRPGTIDILTGIALENIGSDAVKKIIDDSDFPSEDIMKYAREIRNCKNDGREALALAIGKVNYLQMANLIDGLSSGKIDVGDLLSVYSARGDKEGEKGIFKDKFYLQPNKTKQLFAGDARKEVKAIRSDCSSGSLTDHTVGKTANALNIGPMARFYPNYAGLSLYGMAVINMSSARIASCGSQSKLVLIQLLLALKAYQQDKGRLPDSLNALVPDYLPEIPKDPFSGEALKYSFEKKIIYSVGQKGAEQDLVDDGGDKEKDIVMNIGF